MLIGKYIVKDNYDRTISADITGKEILDCAFEIIQASSELIPCRCVLVECGENEKLHSFYKNNNFSLLQYDGEHYQFYRHI